MKIIYMLFVITPFIGGCATTFTSDDVVPHLKPKLTLSKKERWELMVGKWYGEQPSENGGKMQWIVERAEDGTYKTVFRANESGKSSEKVEVGLWAISGPVYFSTYIGDVRGDKIIQVDRSDPYNYDAYEIIKLDENTFKYRHYDMGTTFTARRVDSDFQFPE